MAVFCLEILVFMLSSLKLTSSTLLGKEEIKKIKTIWQSLQDNNDSTEFRNPVHWEEMGLIDYPQLVKHPMDLSTINRKLREDKYRTVEEVLDDIQLIWDNCKSYNQQGSWIYDLADKLQRSFKKMVKTFLTNIPMPNSGNTTTKVAPAPSKPEQDEIKYADKIKFTDRIKVLKPEELGILVQKIMEVCPLAFRQVDGEKAQILVDNMDVISFKQILETLSSLQDIDDNMTKRIKSQ